MIRYLFLTKYIFDIKLFIERHVKKRWRKKWSEATISIQDHPCQKKTVAAIEQHCALWTDRVRSYFWATASQRCIYATWPSWSWPSMLLEMPAQPLPQPLSTAASRRRARGARCAAAARGCRIVSGFCSAAQPSVSAVLDMIPSKRKKPLGPVANGTVAHCFEICHHQLSKMYSITVKY